MRIDRIDLYLVRFPLLKPYTMANAPLTYFDTVLLRLQSDGLSGWGEVFPGNEPTLTAAWASAVFDCVQQCLIPRMLAAPNFNSAEQLAERFQDIKGNRHSKALLDLAWWDLLSKSKNEPLYETLAGKTPKNKRKDIDIGLTFDQHESPNEFLDEIHRAVADGFKRITLKIRPGWDIQVLGAVRNEYPSLMIQCDIEGSLNIEKHGETLHRFDDFQPSLLEQPLSSSEFVGHAMLQDSLHTTVGLDESITTLDQAEIAIDLRSAGTFCLKPGKVGGLWSAKMIHDMAQTSEIDCYVGADIMTSIGYRFVAALSTLSGVDRPTDYVRFDEFLTEDPGIPFQPVLKANSEDDNQKRLVLELWSEPGIGFEPNLELIEKNALRHFSSHGVSDAKL